jgi:hypothetical protein
VTPIYILLSGISSTDVEEPEDSTPLIPDFATARYWTRSRASCIHLRPSQPITVFIEVDRQNYVYIPSLNPATCPAHCSLWFMLWMLYPLGKSKGPLNRRLIRSQSLPRHGSEENCLSSSCLELKNPCRKSVANHSRETFWLMQVHTMLTAERMITSIGLFG